MSHYSIHFATTPDTTEAHLLCGDTIAKDDQGAPLVGVGATKALALEKLYDLVVWNVRDLCWVDMQDAITNAWEAEETK